MRTIETSRWNWDDLVLAVLLLVIAAPRAIYALFHDRPIGSEGTLSLVCVALAFLILVHRNTWGRPKRTAHRDR